MFGEQSRVSRVSRISQRNIYLTTDQLYQPLRNALRKSTVNSSQRISDLSPTKMGRQLRSLSPAEAEIIKSKLLITVNKELVATNKMDRIMGKRFTAVDAVEKFGEPLSPEQFSRVRRGTVKEVVYQVKEEAPIAENIYTSRISNYPPAQRSSSRLVQMTYHSAKPVASNPPTRIFMAKQSPPLKSPPPQELNTSKSMNKFQPMKLESNLSEIKSQQGSKFYDFRASTASQKGTRLSRSRRDEYKYNLFSLIDEPGNTGCKNGCRGNQIVASRIQSNPWK